MVLPTKVAQRDRPASILSIATLAVWRLRQTWFLLCVTTLGMIAAVVIIGAIPLFTSVMTTAGLRSVLTANPENADIAVNASTLGISAPIMQAVHAQMDGVMRQNLGSLVQETQFEQVTSTFALTKPPQANTVLFTEGVDMAQAQTHLNIIQGRSAGIASQPGNTIEVMLTPETAQALHVTVGSTFQLQISYLLQLPTFRDANPSPSHTSQVTAYVAGLFQLNAADSVYWHGNDFQPIKFATETSTIYNYSLLVSNNALFTLFDTIRTAAHTDAIYTPTEGGYTFVWHYHLGTQRIFSSDLDALIAHINNLQLVYLNLYGNIPDPGYPYLQRAQVISPLFGTSEAPGLLDNFQSRVQVARIPVLIVGLQILALVLFFVNLITGVLIERQTETIALLRSRGASSGQIFGALLTQSLVAGILAFVLGIPLAVLVAFALAQRILPAAEQNALNVITLDLLAAAQQVIWYAVVVVLVTLITMSLTLFAAARTDVLAIRRENTRTHKRPFWQRLNLDLIAGIIALVGYGISLYLTNVSGILQSDAQTLVITPLSIIAPFFLIIGCMLLFLRLFPFLLRLGAYLAVRGRGAVSLLAMTSIARAPRQSMRMTMLLALAIAFALFTLVFRATESQHIQDVSTYLAGADFSGNLSSVSSAANQTQVLNQYQHIAGVLSASVGYATSGVGGIANMPIQMRAVDVSTFAHTVIWSSTSDQQTGTLLLQQLIAERAQAIASNIMPVIVDANVSNILQLHSGSVFPLKDNNSASPQLRCIIVGVVQHLPTVNDRVAIANGVDVGGVLLDYQSYATVYTQQAKQQQLSETAPPQINWLWLQTKSDAISLANVRLALASTMPLTQLIDRRALLDSLNNDPLYVVIGGILGIGTITALLLALVGDLLASWLNVRTRLTNFAVLRALGTTPRQITSVLLWEQVVVYTMGLLLGVAFGITFALTVVPSLTITDLNMQISGGVFYSLQNTFPVQVVLPSTLFFALLALVVVFVLALVMMVRVVSRPLLTQALRLNED